MLPKNSLWNNIIKIDYNFATNEQHLGYLGYYFFGNLIIYLGAYTCRLQTTAIKTICNTARNLSLKFIVGPAPAYNQKISTICSSQDFLRIADVNSVIKVKLN